MSKHLYAFGSICRGEIDESSDVDLLACISKQDAGIDSKRFSIYTYERISELWLEGNPFAWHLHLESKLLYASDGKDFLSNLGCPSEYSKSIYDCEKFRSLFLESSASFLSSNNSTTFHISCMFLAARNFATCYSLGAGTPVFSRYAPVLIKDSLEIAGEDFNAYIRARILSTRGYGQALSNTDIERVKNTAHLIVEWMDSLLYVYPSLGLINERI